MSVLVVDSGDRRRRRASISSKALAIGTTPAFQVEVVPGGARDAGDARQARGRHPERRAVAAGGRRRRAEAVRRARRRPARRRSASTATWPRAKRSCCRASSAPSSIAPTAAAATLGYPRLQPSGVRGVQGAAQRRLLRRARLPLPRARAGARPIACSRGSTMAPWRRRRSGSARAASSSGRTTLDDSWTDLRAQAGVPAARPSARAVPRALRAAAVVVDRRTGGRSVDRAARRAPTASSCTPAGERIALRRERPAAPRAERAGRLRGARRRRTRPARPDRIAVNIDPAESDLTPLDPTRARRGRHRPRDAGGGGRAAEAPAELTAEEAETPPGPLVVSAAGRSAAAGRRNGRVESAVAERERFL